MFTYIFRREYTGMSGEPLPHSGHSAGHQISALESERRNVTRQPAPPPKKISRVRYSACRCKVAFSFVNIEANNFHCVRQTCSAHQVASDPSDEMSSKFLSFLSPALRPTDRQVRLPTAPKQPVEIQPRQPRT